MSTFTELKCFNHLLLQKMEEMKKEMEKQKKIYESLVEVAHTNNDGSPFGCEQCHNCQKWFDEDDGHLSIYIDEKDRFFYCQECYEKDNCKIKCCCDCGEVVFKSEAHYSPEGNELCNYCAFQRTKQ